MKKSLVLLFVLMQTFAASLLVPAVTKSGHGLVANLTCDVIPGQGRILVSTNPLIGIDTQASEKTSVKFVSNYLNVNLSRKDVIFVFNSKNTESIEGGSAGAAMALCLISELTNQTLNPGISITGTIDEEGGIGKVGGILQKASAVSNFATIFLIPKENEIISTYTKNFYSPTQGIYIEELEPTSLNLTKEIYQKLGINTILTDSIEDILPIVFSSEDYSLNLPNFTLPIFTEQKRMAEVAKYELSRAEKVVKSFNITEASELLEKAKTTPVGYSYSQANYAFLAYIISDSTNENMDSLANELKKQITKIETSDPHWRSESELRLSWALFSNDGNSAKKEWLMLAAKMISLENFTGKTTDLNWVKDKANDMILKAKKEVETMKISGFENPNAEKSLEFAIESFNDNLYFAATYNAIDAIAWARAVELSPAKLYQLLSQSSEFTDEFSESYRRHAIFLATQKEYQASAYSLFRAELRETVFEKPKFSLSSIKLPSFDWKIFLIFILLYFFFFRKKKTSNSKSLDITPAEFMLLSEVKGEAITLLQDKLQKGEIDEKTYNKLLKELGG